jgi:glycosyltransferase involved in cell wall biosynthesis
LALLVDLVFAGQIGAVSVKILVLHEIDYLEKVIYEIHEFPELLAKAGHDVTFFHFQEGANRSKKNLFRKKEIVGRVVPEAKLALVGPHQFGIFGFDRLWATLSSWPALLRLFRENKFDVVLNYAVPTFGLQALIISAIYKTPFIHRALDSSHEIRESVFRLPILWVEKLMYRFSPLLSANNSAMQRYCENLAGRKKPSVVNYPPLDIAHFSNRIPDLDLRKHLGILPTDSVITYMGSFFYFSGLPEVIKRFAELVPRDPSTKLLLIGGGEQENELSAIVTDLGIYEQVIFTGFVSYDALPKYLALSNVAINPLEISQVASIAFPNKVLQYLATGIPVVSTRLEGLFSAIDGIEGLTWAETPTRVLEIALEVAQAGGTNPNKSESLRVLAALFSPEAALASMEQTLNTAIEINKRN